MTVSDDARVAFLAGLIDDAGLFPPARLPMADAMAAHVAAKHGPYGWAVSRFGCPAGRLGELLEVLPSPSELELLRLSVVLEWSAGARAGLAAVRRFQDAAGSRARIELLEAPLPPADALPELELPGGVTCFFEVAVGRRDRLARDLATVAELRAGAKMRCGGLTADAFPTPAQVAAFMATATELGVPFKATAGLHHAFRHVAADTGFTHHGFVNVVAASVLAHAGERDERLLEALLDDRDPQHFSLERDGLRWRDLEASPRMVAAGRERALVAYGSCSSQEPLRDLAAIGALPAVAAV